MSIKITLDPGHSTKVNRSPVKKDFYEGDNNLEMAKLLKSELERYEGVEIALTKYEPEENPSLEERGESAVRNNSDLFYSIHSNAASDPDAYGVTGFYSVNTPDVKPLCDSLAAATAECLGDSKVRRIITKTLESGKDYYGVLRASEGVKYSMLVEHGFHTNPSEVEKLASPEWRAEWARAAAVVIAEFFGLEPKGKRTDFEWLRSRLSDISEQLLEIANELPTQE